MKDIRERTFDFALRIVTLCQRLDERPGVGRTLGRQLLRSGPSIGANMEEAQAGQSKPDNQQECHCLKGSTRNSLLATADRRVTGHAS